MRGHGVEAIALTNHGDIGDNRGSKALAAEGVLLVHGVEISTLFGDFVVFSPDLDYLATFARRAGPAARRELAADAAVVWVHPAAGGGRSGSAYYPGLESMVAAVVDAVEVYNGNWLGERYVDGAEHRRALGVPRTGGSDAHRAERLMACYTEMPDPCARRPTSSPRIKRGARSARRTAPSRRRRRFGLF